MTTPFPNNGKMNCLSETYERISNFNAHFPDGSRVVREKLVYPSSLLRVSWVPVIFTFDVADNISGDCCAVDKLNKNIAVPIRLR